MRKDGAPPSAAVVPLNPVGKLFLCFETKSFLALLFSITVVTVFWNLQPYYENLLSASAAAAAEYLPVKFAADAESLPIKFTPVTEEKKSIAADAESLPIKFTPVTEEKKSIAAVESPPVKFAADAELLPIKLTPVTEEKKSISAADPNKRTFQPHGSAAALFVKMGAYRGGPRTFAVVGLASKPTHVFGRPWYKCIWNPTDPTRPETRVVARRILPDWGYGRVYTVVVVNCSFPSNPNADNSGGRLSLNAYYSESPRRYERIPALVEAPGSYDESRFRPPRRYEYLYCGSSLYGEVSPARMREWIAYHAWFFGPGSHFVFHDAGGASPAVRAALEPWIKAGRVTLQDVRAQSEYDGYYYNQFLMVNDCLHRYRHVANWTFFFDVDEYIYVPGGRTLESVLGELSNVTQITIEQNAMSSVLCLNDSTPQEHSRQWGFEKLMFRDSRRIRRDRKYAIRASNAYATGVHMSENFVGGTLHKTDAKIRYYHYHNTITEHQELCRKLLPASAKRAPTWLDKVPYVYDDSMRRLASVVKKFERDTIGALE